MYVYVNSYRSDKIIAINSFDNNAIENNASEERCSRTSIRVQFCRKICIYSSSYFEMLSSRSIRVKKHPIFKRPNVDISKYFVRPLETIKLNEFAVIRTIV